MKKLKLFRKIKSILSILLISLLIIPLCSGIGIHAKEKNTESNEYKIYPMLCDRLAREFEIDFPEAEISLVSMYLSKNQKLDVEINSGFDLLDDQVFKILRETMYTIYQDYHKDFRNDDKLFVAIGLHLEPALERLANGQLVENPLKEKIIERHQEEFNYSKILNDVVRHDLNLSFDDDELAFIALHFVVANNRIDE